MGNKKVIKGFLWNFAEKMFIQLVTFVVGIILARKVGPETYGVVGIVATITNILNVATSLHTGTFLMRKKEVDSLDMNTSFFFNLIISVSLFILIFFLAPIIAEFYNNQEIIALLRVGSVGILISPFIGIKFVIIVRNYQYKKYFFISSLGTIVAGIVGIKLAYSGYASWALIAHINIDGIIDAILLWFFIDWKPKLEFSFRRLKEMTSYGVSLWGYGIVDSLTTKIQGLIIGKKYTSADFAFYNRGLSFPSMIESYTNSSLNDVLLRKTSEEQDNIESVKELLNKTSKICLHISFSTMLGLLAVSNSLILLLLGNQWLPSVFFLQIFCVGYAFKPLEATSEITLKAVGKSKEFLKYGFIKKISFLLFLIISVPFGVEAIAIGFVSASILSAIISLIANKKEFNLSIKKQLVNILKPLLISLAMCVCAIVVGKIFGSLSTLLILIIQVLCGVLIYGLSIYFFDKEIFNYLVSTLNQFFKRGKNE